MKKNLEVKKSIEKLFTMHDQRSIQIDKETNILMIRNADHFSIPVKFLIILNLLELKQICIRSLWY